MSKFSEEQLKQIGERFSHPKSEEQKKKISETHRSLRVTCPHCEKQGHPRIMRRWHFDNCREKMQADEEKTNEQTN